jgi:hypothetical protein
MNLEELRKQKRVIWKFEISPTERMTRLSIPEGFVPLHLGLQAKKGEYTPVFWAIVKPEREAKQALFRLYATGEEFDPEYHHRYIGSFFSGPFVWHLFQLFNADDYKEEDVL